MRVFFLSLVVLVAVCLSLGAINLHPLSDEFIHLINSKQSTWKAGRNFDVKTPQFHIRGLMGVQPKLLGRKQLLLKLHDEVQNVPESFDARQTWPECADIIGKITDQSVCGSCWAFGAVEAMSDRICIHSNGTKKVSVSAEDLLSCCQECGNGCYGGKSEKAWEYWQKTGIVTGGGYGTKNGCRSYSFPPCDHHANGTFKPCGHIQPTPKCIKECDAGTNLTYKQEITKGSAYTFSGEKQIQIEIMNNGPVEACFVGYYDLLNYKSGVYQHIDGKKAGYHCVKILGWGVEDGTKYWLVANSWNTEWGDHGYFKILRGKNECDIENYAHAGLPYL